MLMLPMTIKQQKFTKMNSVMTPEIQAIQKKYKDKKDQQSQLAMQEEMKLFMINMEHHQQVVVYSLLFRCLFFSHYTE